MFRYTYVARLVDIGLFIHLEDNFWQNSYGLLPVFFGFYGTVISEFYEAYMRITEPMIFFS